MRKLIEFLKDSNHWKHLVVGFALGLYSALVAMIAGILKEEIDRERGGAFDYVDLGCTVLGGFLGNIVQVVILHFVLR